MDDRPAQAAADPVRQEYDRLAPGYDRRWQAYIDATLDAVVAGLTLKGDDQLLDIPCGTGELQRRLLARWPRLRIVGADLSPAMLSRAQAKDVDQRVTWLEADVHRLPLADASFDVVVCANSFHYFRRPEAALRELHRVLRPQGSLVLVDWCDDFLVCKLCSLWLRWTDPAFQRTYSLSACQALLSAAGFRTLAADRFRVGWVWGMMRVVCRAEVA